MLRKLLKPFGFCLLVNLFFAAFAVNTPAQNSLLVTGPDQGLGPIVKIFNTRTGDHQFRAYSQPFLGGVRVATGDVNGDGIAEIIVAPGPGMRSHVKIFEQDPRRGVRLVGNFLAFNGNFHGGIYVATGDVNGDGRDEVIVGAGAGGNPVVQIVDGTSNTILQSFLAYDASFLGGVNVAAGDVNGDGVDDIITGAGPGGGPHVKIFNSVDLTLINSFLAYDVSFQGGVFVAAGDVNNDGFADIVTGAGPGGGPHVKVFDSHNNLMVLHSFFAFQPTFAGGVRVGCSDFNRDGNLDVIVGAGPGAGPHVKVFDLSNVNPLASFFAYPNFQGGVFVAGG